MKAGIENKKFAKIKGCTIKNGTIIGENKDGFPFDVLEALGQVFEDLEFELTAVRSEKKDLEVVE